MYHYDVIGDTDMTFDCVRVNFQELYIISRILYREVIVIYL